MLCEADAFDMAKIKGYLLTYVNIFDDKLHPFKFENRLPQKGSYVEICITSIKSIHVSVEEFYNDTNSVIVHLLITI